MEINGLGVNDLIIKKKKKNENMLKITEKKKVITDETSKNIAEFNKMSSNVNIEDFNEAKKLAENIFSDLENGNDIINTSKLDMDKIYSLLRED
jgi:hypothetical protein